MTKLTRQEFLRFGAPPPQPGGLPLAESNRSAAIFVTVPYPWRRSPCWKIWGAL